MKTGMFLIVCSCLVLQQNLHAKDHKKAPALLHMGSVLALKGPAQDLGTGMKHGLNASLNGKIINGRKVVIHYRNDAYEPERAYLQTLRLMKQDMFLMIGNVGTPTAKVTLPLLSREGIPAVGFFTGAGILRPAPGPVVNYRASYVQETAAVINEALKHGLPSDAICAYVQNDAYGMAWQGLRGLSKPRKTLG